MMFLSSLFVLLSATLGVVLVGFDSISKPRLTGELTIELAQPISRTMLGINHLFGVWLSVAIPVALLQFSSLWIIQHQMGIFPSFEDSFPPWPPGAYVSCVLNYSHPSLMGAYVSCVLN